MTCGRGEGAGGGGVREGGEGDAATVAVAAVAGGANADSRIAGDVDPDEAPGSISDSEVYKGSSMAYVVRRFFSYGRAVLYYGEP